MSKKLINCKVCGEEIAKAAKSCPKCGAKNKKPIFKRLWFWLIIIVAIGAIAAGGGSDTKAEPVAAEPATTQATTAKATEAVEAEDALEEALDFLEQAVGDIVEEDDSVPTEYKNALKKAKSYSDLMHMSKAGIYNQLVSEYGERFPEDAAQYAVDNLNVDWNENALKKAESYSETMYMSKAAIYDQLISEFGEEFTEEEAQYAIDNIVADWNANALEKAKSYQEMMSMSKAAIYDQLVSEYGEQFTAEEAQYAVDNLE